MTRSAILLALVAALPTVPAARGWTFAVNGHGDENGVATSVAFDAEGDIVAGGSMTAGGESRIGAVKISADGSVRWEITLATGTGYAAVAPNGNVGIAGTTWSQFGDGDVVTAMLDGEDGEPIFLNERHWYGNHWAGAVAISGFGDVLAGSSGGRDGHFTVDRVWGTSIWSSQTSIVDGFIGDGVVSALAIGADGQVFATGRGQTDHLNEFGRPISGAAQILTASLDPVDGSLAWKAALPGVSIGLDVAVDPSGDVIVAGGIAGHPDGGIVPGDMLVVKYAGATGAELWRTVVDAGGSNEQANSVAIDATGDVYVGGRLNVTPTAPTFWDFLGGGVAQFAVLKLAGSNGAEIWRSYIENDVDNVGQPLLPAGVRGEANDVVLDEAGDVVAVGAINASWLDAGPGQTRDFMVAKFAGSDGALQWSHVPNRGEAFAVAVDGGIIAVAGSRLRETSGGSDDDDFMVVGLSDCIEGQSLRFSNRSASRRSLKLVAKDDLIALPGAGTRGDPSIAGARLIVTDVASMDAQALDLPAPYWKAAGRGFVYRDRRGEAGPCSVVKLRRNRLTAKCKGTSLDLLDRRTPSAGVALRLELGTGVPACVEFGGEVRRNDGQGFEARSAPAPSICR